MALPDPSIPPLPLLLSNVPYDKKWDLLKPHIKRLYIDEDRPLPEVISTIKREFDFHASESSYKYYINRKWKLKKSIPASKKLAMCDFLQTRANAGKQTAMTHKGKQVDLKKLRRFMKEDTRQQITMRAANAGIEAGASFISQTAFAAGNRIFLSWNMPYGAMRRAREAVIGGISPSAIAASTPSDVVAVTPSSANAPSPRDAPSPMSAALRDKRAVDRANLFVQGMHHELLSSMNRVERRNMSTWLYQFWLFSFRTAKNWGRGPRNWTADLLRFDKYQEVITIYSPSSHGPANTPDNNTNLPHHAADLGAVRVCPPPSPLCRWAIHIHEIDFEALPDPPAKTIYNPHDEGTWTVWGNLSQAPSFEEKLRYGLESNDFSTLNAADLPVALPQVVKAANRSPGELLVEALGFSIIVRNANLMEELIKKVRRLGEADFGEFYPFHLATSYLDGSKSCCNILDSLASQIPPNLSFRMTYRNTFGHTVLDNLMIAILKSHTSCLPGIVDDVWQKEKRFAGEEVDICGRWDADSDCIRVLLAQGEVAIPFEWKHKFCHTSAQTICHSINAIFDPSYAPDINTTSGLFVKRCLNCGRKLQLTPLHTLVLTAFALAQQGAAGEDLFGILACTLCLLWHGANSLLTVEISLHALWNGEQVDHCSHEELSAVELANTLTPRFQDGWTGEVRTGWQVFCYLLGSSREELRRQNSRAGHRSNNHSHEDDAMEKDYDSENDAESLGMDYECCETSAGRCHFGSNKDLGDIYAAVQTELVTYRRLTEHDLWTSTNFNMEELLWSLLYQEKPRIGLLEKELLKPFYRCGRFREDWTHCVTADGACVSYFMNMDVWTRASFIDIPRRGHDCDI